MINLRNRAEEFIRAHDEARGPVPLWSRVVKLVEEAGEAAGAYVRWSGHSRRSGNIDEFQRELADVVLGAYIIAAELEIDLDSVIESKHLENMSRGFQE